MSEREKELEEALQAFLNLSWGPDSAPEPSYYLVEPVHEARAAIVQAGKLLNGKNPFPADIDGSVMTMTVQENGKQLRMVWLGGMAYGEDQEEDVPEQYKEIFRKALGK